MTHQDGQNCNVPGCTCQLERGGSVLPQEGQRIRVTLQKNLQIWQGSQQVVIPAGTIYEGHAADIDAEGFFDLVDDTDQRMKFYIYDSSLQVETL